MFIYGSGLVAGGKNKTGKETTGRDINLKTRKLLDICVYLRSIRGFLSSASTVSLALFIPPENLLQ